MLTAIANQLGRRSAYGLCGLVLSTGAPLGALILRALSDGLLPDLPWLIEEFGSDLPLYIYLGLSTAVVMGSVGWRVGRYEDRLAALSNLDALTRLPNRRGFEEALGRELSRAERNGSTLSLLMIDVDKFKLVNDNYGHNAGDRALVVVSNSLRATCRKTDVPVRQGGDEFAVLLPSTEAKAALLLANRIATALSKAEPVVPGAPALTLSIGVSQLTAQDDQEGASLLARADTAMYRAKATGRARAVWL